MKNTFLIIISCLLNFLVCNVQAKSLSYGNWEILKTVQFNGKQDDIFFINPNVGWYGNGQGYIYKTLDGGTTWYEIFHQPGTFVRALGFIDENVGFAGNIGPDYFPGVTDNSPLYKTTDGGKTWNSIKDISGQELKGVCSIDVLHANFINSGLLDQRTTVRAAGRVGGPAEMATSRDGGLTWKTDNLSSVAGMILDVKFIDESTGFLCAASHPSIDKSKGRVLKTTDGGDSWRIVYESKGPSELIWKCSFPSDKVGYATLQSYDTNPSNSQRYIIKTVDGGETWTELPLVNDFSVREFGVGFLNEHIGWVGAVNGGYFTEDGGQTWIHQPLGKAINKIRIIESDAKYDVFAIGVDVRKLSIEKVKN